MVQWFGLSPFSAVAWGSIPGQGNKIPQATQCGQKRGGEGSNYFCTDEMKFLWFLSFLSCKLFFIQKDNTYWERRLIRRKSILKLWGNLFLGKGSCFSLHIPNWCSLNDFTMIYVFIFSFNMNFFFSFAILRSVLSEDHVPWAASNNIIY